MDILTNSLNAVFLALTQDKDEVGMFQSTPTVDTLATRRLEDGTLALKLVDQDLMLALVAFGVIWIPLSGNSVRYSTSERLLEYLEFWPPKDLQVQKVDLRALAPSRRQELRLLAATGGL